MWYTRLFPFAGENAPILNSKMNQRLASMENNRQYEDLFTRMVALSLNIFEWDGLPDTCDPYFLEEILLYHGFACIVKDENMGFLTLPCMPAEYQNLYYEHNYYRAYSINYARDFMALTHYNKDIFEEIAPNDVTDGGIPNSAYADPNAMPAGAIPIQSNGTSSPAPMLKGVVCLDNPMRYPFINTIDIYATKRLDAHRTVDVCAKGLKTPAIIETDEDTKVAIQKAVTMIDQNVIAVYAGKGVAKAIKETKQIPTGFTAQNLEAAWNHLNNVDGQFYTAFGINNLNTADKKERLITDEVNSNDEQIALNAYVRLDQRLHFIENLQAVFPGDFDSTTCKIKHQDEQSATTEGGDMNGSSYNDPNGRSANGGSTPV